MFEHLNNQVVVGADNLANEIIVKWSFSGGDDPVMHLEQPANACKDCL